MKSQTFLFIAFLLLGAAAVLTMLGNPLWWPCLIVGGLLFVGNINHGRPESLWSWVADRRRSLLIVYGIYAAIGLGQEVVGWLTNIWTYGGVYATWIATVLLVIVGYPLFLVLVNEIHVALSYAIGPGPLVWAADVIFLLFWSEMPNLLAPLYEVNPPFAAYRLLVFGIGYAIQAVLAVAVRKRVGG